VTSHSVLLQNVSAAKSSLLLHLCRRFWQQLLGGLTLLDLAVICVLAVMNSIWTYVLLSSKWRLLLPKAALQGYAAPTIVSDEAFDAAFWGSGKNFQEEQFPEFIIARPVWV
jgi:hypothetical protein